MTEKVRGRPRSGGREEILKATLALLRERGMARLTTREIASQAGVSEGSIFYYFTDRSGLLQAVFAQALQPLQTMTVARDADDDAQSVLRKFSEAVDRFLASGLDCLVAAQADAELREALFEFLAENNYGPHRGIIGLSSYLAEQQEAGAVRADVDPKVIAYLVVSDAFHRAAQPKLFGHRRGVPGRDAFFDTLTTLISATG